MDTKVLDAWALVAWLLNQPAAPAVDALLSRATAHQLDLRLSVINAGEVYYQLVRKRQPNVAVGFWYDVVRGSIPVRMEAATPGRVERAARIKATNRLSYADAFAVGLAQELRTPLVTADPEIRAVAEANAISVDWLGS